jgi:nucleoside-diphosphate-sugar epimerase
MVGSHSGSLRVLVTGASGFVGKAIAQHLRAVGHSVVGTVNSRKGGPEDVVVDARQRAAFDAIAAGRFDVVVHSAGVVNTKYFDSYMRLVNVDGTAHALEFARARGATHFVHIGSIAAYGVRSMGEERDEATPLSSSRVHPGETDYLRTKAAAERLVAASGLPFTTLRLPVVIGPGSTFSGPALGPILAGGSAPFVGRNDRRVSVTCLGNVGPIVESMIAHGPAGRSFNACDHHMPWKDFVTLYASELGIPIEWRRYSYATMALRARQAYWIWFVMAGLRGSHFPTAALDAARPFVRRQSLVEAVNQEIAAARSTHADHSRERTS